jgi:hypothetical protein
MATQTTPHKPPRWLATVILVLSIAGAAGLVWLMLDTERPTIAVTVVDRPPARPGAMRMPSALAKLLDAPSRKWSDADSPDGIRAMYKGYWRAKSGNLVMGVEQSGGTPVYTFSYIKMDFVTPELRLLSAACEEARTAGAQGRIPNLKAQQIQALRPLSKPQGVSVADADLQRAQQAFTAWEQADAKSKPAAERELISLLAQISKSSYDPTRRTYLAYGNAIKAVLATDQLSAFQNSTGISTRARPAQKGTP